MLGFIAAIGLAQFGRQLAAQHADLDLVLRRIGRQCRRLGRGRHHESAEQREQGGQQGGAEHRSEFQRSVPQCFLNASSHSCISDMTAR